MFCNANVVICIYIAIGKFIENPIAHVIDLIHFRCAEGAQTELGTLKDKVIIIRPSSECMECTLGKIKNTYIYRPPGPSKLARGGTFYFYFGG
jgi:hypothetical protein